MTRYLLIGFSCVMTALPIHAQSLDCTGRLDQDASAQEVVKAMKCLEKRISEQYGVNVTSPPTRVQPAHLDLDALVPLRVYAEGLSTRAQKGVNGSTRKAMQLADDYSSLVAQMQAVVALDAEPFVDALEPLGSTEDPDQSSAAVSDLAAGLGDFLKSLNAMHALNTMFTRLAAIAEQGVNGSTRRAEVLRDQYNLSIRVAKAVFPDSPYVAAQPEYKTIHDPDETAATVLQAARSLATFTQPQQE